MLTNPPLTRAACFNQGSDARINGRAEDTNPYRPGPCAAAWRHGWRHAARLFGLEARWPYRAMARLPGSGPRRLLFPRARSRGYVLPDDGPRLPQKPEAQIAAVSARVWSEMPAAEREGAEQGQAVANRIRQGA